jgi:hypothetical protein
LLEIRVRCRLGICSIHGSNFGQQTEWTDRVVQLLEIISLMRFPSIAKSAGPVTAFSNSVLSVTRTRRGVSWKGDRLESIQAFSSTSASSAMLSTRKPSVQPKNIPEEPKKKSGGECLRSLYCLAMTVSCSN